MIEGKRAELIEILKKINSCKSRIAPQEKEAQFCVPSKYATSTTAMKVEWKATTLA
jgi:hypothetical protein